MENRTNFNLNKSIKIWRSELLRNSKITSDNINELESHLRDEMDELKKLDLSIEETFLIAKNRIGTIDNLKEEFNKINNGFNFKNSIIPYIKGILLFIFFTTLTKLTTNFTVIIANKFHLSENTNYISIGTLTLFTLLSVIITYRLYKNTNLILRKLTNIPILVSAILICKTLYFLCKKLLTPHSFKMSQISDLLINISIYNIILIVFILIFSLSVFYSLKKENKVKIAE